MDKEKVFIYIHICVCVYTHTYIYTQQNNYLAIENNEIMSLAATWIHLEIIIPREVS